MATLFVGWAFKVRMDQHSLIFLMDQRVSGSDQQKWIVKMLDYDFRYSIDLGIKTRPIVP